MNKIREALEKYFKPNKASQEQIVLDPDDEGRIYGYVVSGVFDFMSTLDRQLTIDQILKDVLNPNFCSIACIMAYTPAEFAEVRPGNDPDGKPNRFAVLRQQSSEGCGPSLSCGTDFTYLPEEIRTMNQARAFVEKWDDEETAFTDDREFELSKATILEIILPAFEIDLDSLRAKKKAAADKVGATEKEKADLAQLEKLKKQYPHAAHP